MTDKTTYPSNPPIPFNSGAVRPRYGKLYWLAFLLGLVYYFGMGAFPMGPFKGDGTGMASGARQILEQSWDGPKIEYGRDTRPGVFLSLIFLRWLSGADTYLMFSAIALAAGVANVLLVAWFAAHYSRLPVPLCGLGVLILFPDAVTWGCYPNGTVIAGCLGTASLCLLTRRDQISTLGLVLAGVAAGLAVLFRVDAVLLGLTSVVLLSTRNVRATAVRLGIFNIAAVVVVGIGLYAIRFDVVAVLQRAHQTIDLTVRPPLGESLFMRLASHEGFTACLAYFPLLTVLLIFTGIFRLFRQRRWDVLAMVAAGVVPIVAVYRTLTYGSPLYFLAALFACLAAVGVQGIMTAARRNQIVLGIAAGLLFAVQYPVGINLSLRSKSRYPVAEPTLVHLGEWQLSSSPISKIALGIGPGGSVANTENVRFCSGLLFHPLALHNVKRQINEAFEAMKQAIQSHEAERPPLLVYTSEWCTNTQVHKALQDLGYTCVERAHVGLADTPGDRFVWRRDRFTIIHLDAWEIYAPWNHPEYFQDAPSRQRFLYVTGGGREQDKIEKSGHVRKALFRRDVMPSESVSVFEMDMNPVR
ncbi:MAG: hypothetical protein WCJ35_04380 [Planctomycetota bacterium]